MVFIGTAGWSIPRPVADRFPGAGAHLERYARVLRCAEINSTFKHEHRAATYRRWAEATPPGFRFSVKLPHQITHVCKLEGIVAPLERFLSDIAALGDRLGPLLVQLPGSLALSARAADSFFAALRRRFAGAVVCEPRHASWFDAPADALLLRHRIGRVGADPVRAAGAGEPGGWLGDADHRGVAYFRWHGSPQVYRSSYPAERIAAWAREAAEWNARADCWCVFDNTASGAAAQNALDLEDRIGSG